jgi:hypothetical protein
MASNEPKTDYNSFEIYNQTLINNKLTNLFGSYHVSQVQAEY